MTDLPLAAELSYEQTSPGLSSIVFMRGNAGVAGTTNSRVRGKLGGYGGLASLSTANDNSSIDIGTGSVTQYAIESAIRNDHNVLMQNKYGLMSKSAVSSMVAASTVGDLVNIRALSAKLDALLVPVDPVGAIKDLQVFLGELTQAVRNEDDVDGRRAASSSRMVLRSLRDDTKASEGSGHSYGMMFNALLFTPFSQLTEKMIVGMRELVAETNSGVSTRSTVRAKLEQLGFYWFPANRD